jgi:LemA protein
MIIIVLVVLAMVWFVLYNTLVQKKNQVTNVFATIDALLKKRYDLIPNLVAAVKNYMEYEKGVLTQITELRAKAVSGNLSDDEKVSLENKLSKLMGDIRVAVENYPDLKANQNFLQLQGALNETEEQLSAARRAYNAAVTDYNNAIEMYPTNVVASVMNYKTKLVFEAAPEEKKNVDVNDLFKKKT